MVCPWCHAHGQAQLAALGGLPELLGRGQVHVLCAPCGEGTSTVPHAYSALASSSEQRCWGCRHKCLRLISVLG